MTMDSASINGANAGQTAARLAKDAIDGIMQRAKANMQPENTQEAPAIDPELNKKLVDREIRMAADPDFELQELAKERAAKRMRQVIDGPSEPRQEKPPNPEENIFDRRKANEEIGLLAKVLLDRGLPKEVVAQFLLGSGVPAIPINIGNQPGNGSGNAITLTDVFNLMDRMNARKDNSELTETIKEMREEIKALRSGQGAAVRQSPTDPVTQIQSLTSLVDGLAALGIVKKIGTELPPPQIEGEPLEVVKEKNRHAAELKRIELEERRLGIDQDNNNKKIGLLGEIPEKIAEGIASHMISAANSSSPITGPAASAKEVPANVIEYFSCPNKNEDNTVCGTRIEIHQGENKVTCPKCGTIYGP